MYVYRVCVARHTCNVVGTLVRLVGSLVRLPRAAQARIIEHQKSADCAWGSRYSSRLSVCMMQ